MKDNNTNFSVISGMLPCILVLILVHALYYTTSCFLVA